MPPFNDLFLAINQFAIDTSWLNAPMADTAKYGILIFAVLIILGWWLARKESAVVMAAALLVPATAVLAYVFQQVLDNGFNEARPYTIHPDILVLVSRTTDPSFPSDHACAAGAIAAGLFFVNRKLGIVASICAVVLAFSRVYSGAHWPADVVVGLAFGAVVAVVLIVLLRKPVAKLVEKLRTSPVKVLVTQ